ncbi:MAG: hypothetical protein SH819_04435 [Cytophagales bacterium]|nr:hypothetical protein [Cytophagales bacterium]
METICFEKGISELGCGLITGGLYFMYFLLFVAAMAVIVLPLMNALKAPKELVKSGAAFGLLIVIFLISFAISGDEVTLKTAAIGTTQASSKMIGAGLIMLYVVFFSALIGLVYSFFHKAIR